MDWDQDDNATKLTSKKEYDCVICNQTTPSSEDAPMGLVVLVQVIKKYLWLLLNFSYGISLIFFYIFCFLGNKCYWS